MALQHICVGIDDSPAAVSALEWAAGLAHESDASLLAIHVWQQPFVCTYPWQTPSTEESVAHARQVVRATVDAAGADQRVETLVVRGQPGPALAAEANDSDLIVVGCTGDGLRRHKPELGEVLFGSTARYVVHHSDKPVVAVPEGTVWSQAPTVVVGIDGSDNSKAALTWATREFPADAVIHAVQAIEYPCTGGSIPIDYELLDPMVETRHEELDLLVRQAIDPDAAAAGRQVATHVVLGYAADALVDTSLAADIIVVGEHGDTAAAKRVLGSVSDYTLRHAKVPVLVVPSPTHVAA